MFRLVRVLTDWCACFGISICSTLKQPDRVLYGTKRSNVPLAKFEDLYLLLGCMGECVDCRFHCIKY